MTKVMGKVCVPLDYHTPNAAETDMRSVLSLLEHEGQALISAYNIKSRFGTPTLAAIHADMIARSAAPEWMTALEAVRSYLDHLASLRLVIAYPPGSRHYPLQHEDGTTEWEYEPVRSGVVNAWLNDKDPTRGKVGTACNWRADEVKDSWQQRLMVGDTRIVINIEGGTTDADRHNMRQIGLRFEAA